MPKTGMHELQVNRSWLAADQIEFTSHPLDDPYELLMALLERLPHLRAMPAMPKDGVQQKIDFKNEIIEKA
jgi:hypothetical protein